MSRKNTLNNVTMENIRKTQVYQAVITDLAIEGAIALDAAERLLGYEIPEYLHGPTGKCVKRGKAATAADEGLLKGKGKRGSE